jgi:hypothetical protein
MISFKTFYNYRIFGILLLSLFLISPFFAIIQGLSTFIALCIFISIILPLKKLRNSKLIFLSTILIYSTFLIPTLFHIEVQFLLIPIFLIISIFIVNQLTIQEIHSFVKIASVVLLIFIYGSILGFIYAFLGGKPILSFSNPDGRTNYIFLTTMSNSVWGNIIRPSGIYDEPGAFSFFICCVAGMRHLLSLDRKLTWKLLLFGLITFSVAHIIYIIFHFVSEKKIFKLSFSKLLLTLFTTFIIFFFVNIYFADAIDLLFTSRFQNSNSGLFPGDNRSNFFFNTLNYIYNNPKVILWGKSLLTDFEKISFEYGNVGANVLMPLLRYGIFASWPFYFIIFYFLIKILKGRFYFVCIGFVALLAQREFIYVVSYSTMMILIITILQNKNINEKKGFISLWDTPRSHQNGTIIS